MDNYTCYNCMWEGTHKDIKHVMVDNPHNSSVLEEKECCPECKSYESLVNVDESQRYENRAHAAWAKYYL